MNTANLIWFGDQELINTRRDFSLLKLTENKTIREQVYEQLRNLITTNTIPPGSRLYENKLAEELGVSRTPIREALHALEREGFLEAIPRVGYAVRTPSLEELKEIVEIRKALESLSAIWASSRLNKTILKALEKNLKQTDEIYNKGELDKFTSLNDEFHETIDRTSGGRRICEMNRMIRDYMYFHRIDSLSRKALVENAIDCHKKIFKYMKEKNEDKIREAINQSMERLGEHVSKDLFPDK